MRPPPLLLLVLALAALTACAPRASADGPSRLWVPLANRNVAAEATVTATPSPTAVRPDSDSWASGPSLRSGADGTFSAVSAGGRLYAVGGHVFGINTFEYDPGLGSWQSKARTRVARLGPGLATVDGKVYAAGGTDTTSGSSTAVLEQYDPATATWTTRAPMATARSAHALVALPNGRLLAIGGVIWGSASTPLDSVEEYDPVTDSWRARRALPGPRYDAGAAVAANGRVYVVGGVPGPGYLDSALEYDPGTDTWTTRAPLPSARSALAVVAAPNGRLYAFGGVTNTSFFSEVLEYDPAANSWTSRAPMPAPRYEMGAAELGGRVYLVAGATTGTWPVSTMDVYTPP